MESIAELHEIMRESAKEISQYVADELYYLARLLDKHGTGYAGAREPAVRLLYLTAHVIESDVCPNVEEQLEKLENALETLDDVISEIKAAIWIKGGEI